MIAARSTRTNSRWAVRRFWRMVVLFSASAPGICLSAQAPAGVSAATAIAIVLPPRIVARQPATLAVLTADGRLAPDVTVALGNGQQVKTDWTGRASFAAPNTATYLVATASNTSATTLVDAPHAAKGSKQVSIAPVVSLHDRFSICGAGLRGDAESYVVRVNGQTAVVLAASPECIVVLPGAKTASGPAIITIEAAGISLKTATTLVSFDFAPPDPPLLPGKKGMLTVRARGTAEKLKIAVENESPGVLKFQRGDVQELTTSGGTQNSAQVKVQAVRSGAFSFHAHLLPVPQTEFAQRFLTAAQPLATKELQASLRRLADRLARHPRDSAKVKTEIEGMEINAATGDFRALLTAAHDAL